MSPSYARSLVSSFDVYDLGHVFSFLRIPTSLWMSCFYEIWNEHVATLRSYCCVCVWDENSEQINVCMIRGEWLQNILNLICEGFSVTWLAVHRWDRSHNVCSSIPQHEPWFWYNTYQGFDYRWLWEPSSLVFDICQSYISGTVFSENPGRITERRYWSDERVPSLSIP